MFLYMSMVEIRINRTKTGQHLSLTNVNFGEQTYCRKWVFDKMPKIVLGHNGKKIFPKFRLGIKCRIFFFLILLSFYLQNICLNIK